MKTSISILSMNRPDTLRATVRNVLDTARGDYEIIIVDNNSTDPSAIEYLDSLSDSIKVIRNTSNKGLSGGTNQGFEESNGDFLIHLDDDAILPEIGWNIKLASYLEIPEVAMALPGLHGEYINREGYHEIKWGLGMCYALTRSIYEDIGGYDPQLYHQNECDMALRVRMAGFKVAGIKDLKAIHNDPGGLRSDISLAREHIGCVQFRDKWASYFHGRNWNYGTDPISLMQHWPPDEEFMREWSLQNGVNINPAPELIGTDATKYWDQLDSFSANQKLNIAGSYYLIHRTLRNDYMHWEHQNNPGAYERDRQIAIDKWYNLTGELYEGYKWQVNVLRPY